MPTRGPLAGRLPAASVPLPRHGFPARTALLLLGAAVGVSALATDARATDVSGSQSGTWTLANSPYYAGANVTVASGQTLTLQAGVIVVLDPNVNFTVSGTLHSLGTVALPIDFVDGGDANWGALIAQSGSTLDLQNTTLVDGGGGGPAAALVSSPGTASVSWRGGGVVWATGAGAQIAANSITLANVTFSDNGGDGVSITPAAPPAIDTLTAYDNLGYPLRVNSNPGSFSSTIYGRENLHNGVYVAGQLGGTKPAAQWHWPALPELPYICGTLNVDTFDTLEVDAGAILKFTSGAALNVGTNGRLLAQGALSAPAGRVRPQAVAGLVTLDQPVWLTSAKDDSHAGDTNGDSTATTPVAGDWAGIVCGTGSQLRLQNTWIAYAGLGGAAVRSGSSQVDVLSMSGGGVLLSAGRGIDLKVTSATLTGARIARNVAEGANLASANASQVHGCAFFGNGAGNALMDNLAGTKACISATSCWWGHPSGPRHATVGACAGRNNGLGSAVDDNVIFDFWLAYDPTDTPPGNAVLVSPEYDDSVLADTTSLRWTAAQDLDGDTVTYSLRVARDANFTQMVLSADGLTKASYPGKGLFGSGITYYWSVVTRDGHGGDVVGTPQSLFFTTLARPVVGVAPAPGPALRLASPAPNPFRGATRLRFSLPRAGAATLSIYDLAGRRVRELWRGPLAAGPHGLGWDGTLADGRAAPAGVYFARLEAGGQAVTRRVVRTK